MWKRRLSVLVSCAITWGTALAENQGELEAPPHNDTACKQSLESVLHLAGARNQSLMATRGISRPMATEGSVALKHNLASRLRGTASALLILERRNDQVCGHLLSAPLNSVQLAINSYWIGSLDDVRQWRENSRASYLSLEKQSLRAPSLTRAIARADTPKAISPSASKEALLALQERLLPSRIFDRIRGHQGLLILPFGELSGIPFALLKPQNQSSPLIDFVDLAILPQLLGTEAQDPGATEPLTWNGTSEDQALILANPDFSAHKQWTFPSLPGAEQEGRNIAKKVASKIYVGREATAAAFRENAKQASILYFATHAVADEAEAMDSGFIALSDKLLTPREIQGLRLPPNLAVLSACQTGLGKSHDGGTIGLARAFVIAGSFGVVMSLWSVDDQATESLMTMFMDELAKVPPQSALARAMKKQRAKTPDPDKWAAFQYFGWPLQFKQSEP